MAINKYIIIFIYQSDVTTNINRNFESPNHDYIDQNSRNLRNQYSNIRIAENGESNIIITNLNFF